MRASGGAPSLYIRLKTLLWQVPRLCSKRIYPEDMEEAFAEARIIIDHGLVVGACATRAGVRAGWSFDGGSLARDGHDVGDHSGVSGPLHAGRIRYAGGRFLPNEERRGGGRQDTRQPGDRRSAVLGLRLRSGLRRG